MLAATFHPTDPALLVTCGRGHVHFWALEGASLSKRQGIFEVRAGALGSVWGGWALGARVGELWTPVWGPW